jgi:type IV secretion system protein VirB8
VNAEPGIAEYLAEARGWDFDRAQAERRSARRAWWVAGVSAVVAVAAVGAVAALTPLKSVEPYVIRVDNATGVVDVVPGLQGPVSASQSLTRHLLTQYVITRERYVPALAETDYETVGAMQGAALNQAWAALWNRTNPESPLNVHADGSASIAQVTSVSFLKAGSGREDLAQVRFVLHTGEAGVAPARHYVATVQYAYGDPSQDDRRRAANPLGFKVLEYRREPEVAGGPDAGAER